jgi:hypothetical protein
MDVGSNTREALASFYYRYKMIQRIPMLEDVARNVNMLFWRLSSRPIPPPGLFKARTVRKYAKQYGLRSLVETGTYRGGMIATVKRDFDEIYSIELSDKLHAVARERFAKDKHVTLICGDSGEELPRVVERLACPALFWLDAHYSGGETAKGIEGNPIMREIACVLKDRKAHVILVDDMRLFGADPAYPTPEALTAKITEMAGERVTLEIRDDILRITPTLAVLCDMPGALGGATDRARRADADA